MHAQTHIPNGQEGRRSIYNEALKRSGSAAIRFDPEMVGRQGHPASVATSKAVAIAIQTFHSTLVLFGMASRQATGLVVSLARLIGLDRAVADFDTLSSGHKTWPPTSPTVGSKGLVHLLIRSRALPCRAPDSTGTPIGDAPAVIPPRKTAKPW